MAEHPVTEHPVAEHPVAEHPVAPGAEGWVAILDRTGTCEHVLPAALDRMGSPAAVVDLGNPVGFGAASPRADVLVLGPRELSGAGLTRLARYRGAHPAILVVALVGPSAPPRAELRAAGVQVAVRAPWTPARVARGLNQAFDAWELLARETASWRGPGLLAPNAAIPEHLWPAEPATDSGLDAPGEPRTGGALTADGPGLAGADDDGGSWTGGDHVPAPRSSPEALEAGGEQLGAADEPRQPALVITVASATGGCGKTFLATNYAALIARQGHRVLLVDLDLQFGEVAAALRVSHPYSVYDGLYGPDGRALPPGSLEDQLDELVAHHDLGFDVLTAPREPALADYVGAQDAVTVLTTVRAHYDVVLVDTPPALNEVVLSALDHSDVVVVLATLDVPSLKNLHVFLDTLRRLRIEDTRLRLILNKVERDVGIDVAGVQEAFRGRFVAQIPQAREVSRAINLGTVAAAVAPRSAVAHQLEVGLAATLPPGFLCPVTPRPARRSLWARLRRARPPAVAPHLKTGGSP